MKKNMKKMMLILIAAFCMLLGMSISASAAKVTIPDCATRSGKNIYWAAGIDGGGPMNCFNVSTKKNKVINKKLQCSKVSVVGKKIICTVNKYRGSEAVSCYIYSMSTTGKKAKKLANGVHSVIIGKQIYFVKTKKIKSAYGKELIDGKRLGVYRMNLDGSKQKCIYKSSRVENLLACDGELLVKDNGYWKKMTTSGKNITYYYWNTSELIANSNNISYSYSFYDDQTTVSANKKNQIFFGRDQNLICKDANGNEKIIRKWKSGEKVVKIVDMDGYLLVGVRGDINYHSFRITGVTLYVVNSKGKLLKTLNKYPDVSGGIGF